MEARKVRCSRRKFFAQAAALTVAGGLSPSGGANVASPVEAFRARPPRPARDGRQPIAALCTVCRPLSETQHILDRFLYGYTREGRFHVPRQRVDSLFVDQRPDNDLSRAIGREFGVRVCRSIAEALTGGTDRLAVEGILLIGEHGNYPRNDRGQILYPRWEMMEQIVATFQHTGQAVPVFCAKHLSHRWDRAQQMVRWSQELPFPLMAGSSLPVTWRRPELELPAGSQVEDVLVAAYGPIEVYGFHALEALQGMMERRRGGEVGVRAVTCLTGNAVWSAGDVGQWSWELLEHALGRSETVSPGDLRRNVGRAIGNMPAAPATAFLIEYRDGVRGTVLLLTGHIQDFCFAARLRGAPVASCLFHVPPLPGAKSFDCLVANLEGFLGTGKPPYPVERTLLTGGILEAAMESHYRRGIRIETPQLDIRYMSPADSGFVRGSVAAPV